MCDGVFKGFRNYSLAIENVLIHTIRGSGNMALNKIVGSTYDNSKERSRCLCCIIIRTFGSIVCHWLPCRANKPNESVAHRYYNAYYSLSEKKLLGYVPLIERQVSLFRNCLIPIFLLTLTLGYTKIGCCIYFGIGFIILMFVVMVQRQQKVYRMVWESYNYYDL